MPGCNFVAHGKDDSEVMKKAAEHAKRAHRMVAIAMEVEKKSASGDPGCRGLAGCRRSEL
jgi:precorrin-6B methylase 2